MFKRNEKTAERITKILEAGASYDKTTKTFYLMTNKSIEEEQFKKLRKLGLEVRSINLNGYIQNQKEVIDSFTITLKRKGNKMALIVGVLSFQVFLGLIQFLFIASKANLP